MSRRMFVTSVVIGIFIGALISLLFDFDADGYTVERGGTDATPLSCDGKPVDFHVERAKKLIRRAYDRERILDPNPVTRDDRLKWGWHKRCVLDDNRRKKLGYTADRAKAEFAALFVSYVTPPGEAFLASLRWCESGSSGSYAEDEDAGYAGAYQFDATAWAMTADGFRALTGIDPEPDRNALPREQDIRAAILYRDLGNKPWPNCP